MQTTVHRMLKSCAAASFCCHQHDHQIVLQSGIQCRKRECCVRLHVMLTVSITAHTSICSCCHHRHPQSVDGQECDSLWAAASASQLVCFSSDAWVQQCHHAALVNQISCIVLAVTNGFEHFIRVPTAGVVCSPSYFRRLHLAVPLMCGCSCQMSWT